MAADARSWLSALRRFMAVSALGHLAWETLQLPLYSIWFDGSGGKIAFAVVHCTGGDIGIAAASLLVSLLVFGKAWPTDWPAYRNVAASAIALGVAYTAYSEWLNVFVRKSWTYSPFMPLVPPLEIGLTPLVQWLVVPGLAFLWTWRAAKGIAITS